MVAYNFQKQFADPIRDGSKKHTIRRNGKRSHAKRGSALQLYTGMRTKSCEKICDDHRCLDSFDIRIRIGLYRIEWIQINDHLMPADWHDQFAAEDGFEDAKQMHEFFLKFNEGAGVFENAKVIVWADSVVLKFLSWASKLAHMLGAGVGSKKRDHGYRNYYCAPVGTECDQTLQAMKDEGLVVDGVAINDGRDRYYHATLKGCQFINLSKSGIERAFEE